MVGIDEDDPCLECGETFLHMVDPENPCSTCFPPDDYVETEYVVAAAHLYDLAGSEDPRAVPTIVSAPPPARHHNLFALMGGKPPTKSGFITSTGRFVERDEALRMVLANGQPLIEHPSRHPTMLFSEDLW